MKLLAYIRSLVSSTLFIIATTKKASSTKNCVRIFSVTPTISSAPACQELKPNAARVSLRWI